MKKFLFVLGFFFVAFIPLKVKASYLPSVPPNNAIVPDFLQTVAQTQMAQDIGVYSSFKPDYDRINQIVNGRTINNSMVEVYTDNGSIQNWQDVVFYDFNGNIVDPSDTFTAWGSSDVGAYSYVASKETGEILGQIGRGDNIVSTLQAGQIQNQFPQQVRNAIILSGGSLVSSDIYQQVEIAKNIQNYAVYNADDLTTSEKNFIESYDFHLYCHSNNWGWTLFIPNTCSTDVVTSNVDSRYSYSGYVDPNQFINCPNIFAKDNQSVIFVGGDTSNWGYLKPQGTSYFGQQFNYVNSWYQTYNVLGFPNGGYLDFRSPTQVEYNQMLSLQDKFVYLQPLEDNSVTNNENNYYNYTYVTENPPDYNTYVNNNYETGDTINENNYPIYYTASFPDYTTENNYINYIYNYYTTPQEGETIGNISDPILPENIPILSNLEYRFPFSIPFDMYKLLKGLSVPRETPVIDISFTIPRANIDWDIYYDMAPFDDTAHLFRILFLISYIIGLAYFSYDHFFGR